MTPMFSTVPTGTTGATSPDSNTSVPVPHPRWADCGSAELPGWQVGWAQIIGARHALCSEDSVAYSSPQVNTRQGDEHATAPQALCLAVADGVGGGSYGEVASAALTAHCTQVPVELLGHPQTLVTWMELAEGQVQIKLRERGTAPGAATLAAAWLLPPSITPEPHTHNQPASPAKGYLMRVGDARLYQFDGQTVQTLTTDQTYAAMGEDPGHATPDDPARMVGTGYMGAPEVQPLQLAAGHTLLLVSDGLHRGLSPPAIAALLRQQPNLQAAARELAQTAQAAGSDDDITVLLARPARPSTTLTQSPCQTVQPVHLGFFARLRHWLYSPVSLFGSAP